MVENINNITSSTNLTLLLLKEVRLERNMHSAVVAERIGKTPSAWAKIENGQNAFQMDLLFQVCQVLSIIPSSIISSVEKHAVLLVQNNWAVLAGPLQAGDDYLLQMASEYYNSPGFKYRHDGLLNNYSILPPPISVFNTPWQGSQGEMVVVDLFRYILDSNFRDSQNSLTTLRMK